MWSVDLPLVDHLVDGLLETDRPTDIFERDKFDNLGVSFNTFVHILLPREGNHFA